MSKIEKEINHLHHALANLNPRQYSSRACYQASRTRKINKMRRLKKQLKALKSGDIPGNYWKYELNSGDDPF